MICVLNSDTWILDELTEHLHVLKENDSQADRKLNLKVILNKLQTLYAEFGLKHFILRERKNGSEILKQFEQVGKFLSQHGRIKRIHEFHDYQKETEYFIELINKVNNFFELYTDGLESYKFQQPENLLMLSQDLFRQLVIFYEEEEDYSLIHWLRSSLLGNLSNEQRDSYVQMFNEDPELAFKDSFEKFYSIYPLANSEHEHQVLVEPLLPLYKSKTYFPVFALNNVYCCRLLAIICQKIENLGNSFNRFKTEHVAPLREIELDQEYDVKLEVQRMIEENKQNVREALEGGRQEGEIVPKEVESRIVSTEQSPEGLHEVKEVDSLYEHSRISARDGRDQDKDQTDNSILGDKSNTSYHTFQNLNNSSTTSQEEGYSNDLESLNSEILQEERDQLTQRKLFKMAEIIEGTFSQRKYDMLSNIIQLGITETLNLRKAQQMRIHLLLSKSVLGMAQNLAKKRNLVVFMTHKMQENAFRDQKQAFHNLLVKSAVMNFDKKYEFMNKKEVDFAERYEQLMNSITSSSVKRPKRTQKHPKKSKKGKIGKNRKISKNRKIKSKNKNKPAQTLDSLLFTPYATQVLEDIAELRQTKRIEDFGSSIKKSRKKKKSRKFVEDDGLDGAMKPKYSIGRTGKLDQRLMSFERGLKKMKDTIQNVGFDEDGDLRAGRGSSCEACRVYNF